MFELFSKKICELEKVDFFGTFLESLANFSLPFFRRFLIRFLPLTNYLFLIYLSSFIFIIGNDEQNLFCREQQSSSAANWSRESSNYTHNADHSASSPGRFYSLLAASRQAHTSSKCIHRSADWVHTHTENQLAGVHLDLMVVRKQNGGLNNFLLKVLKKRGMKNLLAPASLLENNRPLFARNVGLLERSCEADVLCVNKRTRTEHVGAWQWTALYPHRTHTLPTWTAHTRSANEPLGQSSSTATTMVHSTSSKICRTFGRIAKQKNENKKSSMGSSFDRPLDRRFLILWWSWKIKILNLPKSKIESLLKFFRAPYESSPLNSRSEIDNFFNFFQ